jgi:hypothetical protein
MTTYRIGESGATVFDEHGKPIATLRPGYVVVEGLLKNPGSLADQHHRNTVKNRPAFQKRLQGYADKKIRPAEDKSQPLRAAIKRLDEAHARIEEARRRIRR